MTSRDCPEGAASQPLMNNNNCNNISDCEMEENNNPPSNCRLIYLSLEIESDPKNWINYYKRHLLYFNLKQYKFALADIEKVLELDPSNTVAVTCKALILLKLQLHHEVECYLMKQIVKYNEDCIAKQSKKDNLKYVLREPDDLECILCMRIFYQPVTIPCGHTFCHHCLECLLDHDDKCPFCRSPFTLHPTEYPVNIVIKTVIEKNFPVLLEERKKEIEEMHSNITSNLPLFAINIACFPGEDLPMHIFEPRYKLMMSRVLQGARTFGLIGVKTDPNAPLGYELCEIGCLIKIIQCEVLQDGRSILTTRGIQRFKLVKDWVVDGYHCGKIEYITDELPSEKELEESKILINYTRQKLLALFEKYKCCRAIITCDRLNTVIDQIQSMPPAPVTSSQCIDFSFWLSKVLPASFETKLSLLECQSLPKRMEKIMEILQSYENPHRCVIL